MWDLFLCELRRFRNWATAFAGAHLVLLGFVTRVADLAQLDGGTYTLVALGYALTGGLLGLYQAGSYRRPGAWLQLLHRPVPAYRIALALGAAAMVLLAVGIAVPTALTALYQDTLTARVVDLRHWLLPASAWLVAVSGYLAGVYAMLGRRRAAWLAVAVPALLLFADASGPWMLLWQALLACGLAALVAGVFRPRLEEAPRGALPALAASLPVQAGAYALLVLATYGVELLWVAQGSHPNNLPVPLAGGTKEALVADGRALFLAGLAGSQDARAPLWREQVALSEVFQTGRRWTTLPHRQDLTNPATMGASLQFTDAERRELWTFSHDRMRLVGMGQVDRRPRGELGLAPGNRPFAGVVLQVGDGWMLDAHALYRFDADHRQVRLRARLPPTETIAGAPDAAGDGVALLTDRALYLFDARDAAEDDGLLQARYRVPQPGASGDLSRVDLLELLDGYLVSFTYEYVAHTGTGAPPFQQIVHVDGSGRIQPVARRELRYDYPAVYRYRTWWLSPAWDTVWRAGSRLFAPAAPLARHDTPPVPRTAIVLALALMAGSLVVALWRTRCVDVPRATRWTWALACGALGLPALIAFWLLYSAREARVADARLQPMPA